MLYLQLDITSFQAPLGWNDTTLVSTRNREYSSLRDVATALTLTLHAERTRLRIRKDRSTNQIINRLRSYIKLARVRQIPTQPKRINKLELLEELTYLQRSLKSSKDRNASFRKRKALLLYLNIDYRIIGSSYYLVKNYYRGHYTRYPKKSCKSNENGLTRCYRKDR